MPKILVVDDSSFTRLQIKNLLQNNGFTDIIEASDGLEAVDLFKKHNPELLTMVIIMPNGDGLTAIKQIMQHNIMAKIIVCTELAQNNMVIKSIQAGAKNFVTK
ncbi:MAG: response regulator, partial [Candidatus Gastranaerophilales bacterium]|nr:response regulator [Candidatus Gastranaerophilales bacterium]